MTVKTDVSFRITGPCLSLLLRDCELSVSDQMGFLVGEKSSITKQTISDAEMEEEKIETTITVNGTFPIGLPFVFCSSLGRVNEVTLKDILGSCQKDVVGWYSFRRNSNHGALLRETLLHKELCKIMAHIPHQYFLFCIITTTTDEKNSTYCHRYTFSTLRHRRFQPVSVSEINLGEPKDNTYRRDSAIDGSFKHLQQVLQSLEGINNTKEAMDTLYSEMNKHVESLEYCVSRLQAEADLQMYKTVTDTCNRDVKQTSPGGDESSPSTSSKLKADELSEEY